MASSEAFPSAVRSRLSGRFRALGFKRRGAVGWTDDTIDITFQRSQSNGIALVPMQFTINFEYKDTVFPRGTTRLAGLLSEDEFANFLELQRAILTTSPSIPSRIDDQSRQYLQQKRTKLVSGSRDDHWMGYWSDDQLDQWLELVDTILSVCVKRFLAAGEDRDWFHDPHVTSRGEQAPE